MSWLGFLSRSSTTLVDSGEGLVLMLEEDGDRSHVLVQRAEEDSWLLVSKDDATAENPALSPAGEAVAYISERNAGQIVVVSLITDTRKMIDTKQLEDAGERAGLGAMKLCSWTSIAWSPAGEDLAFFGCAEDDAFSAVVVADVSQPDPSLSIVGATKTQVVRGRQLEWLDADHLVITSPSGDADGPRVGTFEVP